MEAVFFSHNFNRTRLSFSPGEPVNQYFFFLEKRKAPEVKIRLAVPTLCFRVFGKFE